MSTDLKQDLIFTIVIILLFLSYPLMAYDQFEGYDLSNPYPTDDVDWYQIDESRREIRRDLEGDEYGYRYTPRETDSFRIEED